MSWPLSQDFNEAVQNPATAFSDPDLKGGTIGTNAMGVPIPRSGNYADVYQLTSASGQKWAVKCFTRPTSAGLDSRYAAISEHLQNANLPFTVGFSFLPQGIRVRGQWYPIVKMQWVDGYPINAFVRENLNRSTILENMLSLWVRLCRRLRETGMAHCDIQHGNVLLVPAEGRGNSLGLKLVDYDGMFVPALANQPSGEAGHPSFQHPERVVTGAYSADLDRFPHLVVATALRGLLVGGRALWDKYDTGDNLLFTEKDFKNPGQSKLFKELWETGDPFTVGLVGHLALACTKPLPQTPWLDQLMPGGQPPILTPSQERQAAAIITNTPLPPETPIPPAQSVPPHFASQIPYIPPHYPAPQQPAPFMGPQGYPIPPHAIPNAPQLPAMPRPAPMHTMNGLDSEGDGSIQFDSGPRRRRKNSGSMVLPAIIAGVVLVAGLVVGVMLVSGNKKIPTETVQKNEESNPEPAPNSSESKSDPSKSDPSKSEPAKTDPSVKTTPVVEKPAVETPATPVKTQGRILWSVQVSEARNQKARSVRLSLDGTKVIVAQENTGLVDSLDAANGRLLATFREHAAPATAFPFPLPNGRIMSVAREPVMMAWDATTGRATARAPLARPRAGLTAIRPDRVGQYVVMCWDEDASVIDIENGGTDIAQLTLPNGPFGFPAIAIAEDGRAILAITREGQLREVSLPSLQAKERPLKFNNAASITAWSPVRRMAAIRTMNNGVLGGSTSIVNTETGEIVQTLKGAFALPAAFSSNGRYFITCENGLLEQWDTESWTKSATIAIPGTSPTSIDITPDGGYVAFSAMDNKVYFASFSSDAKPVMTEGSGGGTDSVFNRLTELTTMATSEANIDAMRFWAVDRTGKTLYFATDSNVYPIDLATKKFTNRYAPAEGRIRQIWSTLSGEVIAEVRAQNRSELHVLDGQMCRTTGPGIIRLEGMRAPKSIHIASNGTLAVVTRDNGQIACIDLRNGKSLYTYPAEPVANRTLISATAETLIASTAQNILIYPFAERPKSRLPFDPIKIVGKGEIILEDFAPDASAVAIRTPGTDNLGTRFTILNVNDWKTMNTISSAMTGAGVQLRFVGNGARAILTEANQVSLHDVVSGKRLVSVLSTFDSGNPRSVLSPTGEFVLFGTTTGVTLYRTTVPNATMVAQLPMPVGNQRLPVPDMAALAFAEKSVKDTYASDFAKKLPADRKKLAERLYNDARGNAKDPVAQYVMLREGIALAVEVQDVQLLVRAVDSLDEIFEVDGFNLKVTSLEKIAAQATQTITLRATAESIQELAEDQVDKDEFEKALKLLELAAKCQERSGAVAAKRETDQRIAQLKSIRDSFEMLRAAVEKLKSAPDDPDASTALGKFRAFQQGRWDEGFKLLVNSADPILKKLANVELNASTDSEFNDANRGDLWWDFAEKAADAEKTAGRNRAKFWYAKALASTREGPERTRVEKRLAFTMGGAEYKPGLIAEVFVPNGGRKVRGLLMSTLEMSADNTEIVPMGPPNLFGMRWTGMIVPPAPGRYKLIAETRDDVRVTMGTKPDEKKIISTIDKGMGNKEAIFQFGDRPVAINVEFAGQRRRDHGLILKWIRPGSTSEEVIPASALFHKRDDEKLITDK